MWRLRQPCSTAAPWSVPSTSRGCHPATMPRTPLLGLDNAVILPVLMALMIGRLCAVAAASVHFLLPSNNDIHSPLAKSANLSSNFFLLINPPRAGLWRSNRVRSNEQLPSSLLANCVTSNRHLFQRHAHRISERAPDARWNFLHHSRST